MDDEHLREVLESPLDGGRQWVRRQTLVWGLIGVAAAGGILLWAVLGRGGGEVAGDPTTTAGAVDDGDSRTTTTITVPGEIGYPEERFLPGFAAIDGGAVMLFGVDAVGRQPGELYDEIWLYEIEGDSWRRLGGQTRPSARFDLGSAYDSANDVVVVFGGGIIPCFPAANSRHHFSGARGCYESLDDTWHLHPGSGTWEQQNVATAPQARSGHAMAYDPATERVVLFGGITKESGQEELTYLSDTWLYDPAAATWTEVTSEVSPGGRGSHTMAYDAESGRIVLWGGMLHRGADPLLWAYDTSTNTWSPLETTHGPEESWDGTLVDSPGRGMVLFDGEGVTTYEIAEGVSSTGIRWRNLVWHLDLGTGVWTEREPPGVLLEFQGAAADPAAQQIVVWTGDVTLRYDPAADTWERGSAAAGE